MAPRRALSGTFAFLCIVFSAFSLTAPSSAQVENPPAAAENIPGRPLPPVAGIPESTRDIMARQAVAPPKAPRPEHELEYPDRSGLPQNPAAIPVSRYPVGTPPAPAHGALAIHTTDVAFNGATLTDTGAFPPDSMGTAGPDQYIVFVNGRIRSFTKAGVADGVLNADPDVFFASVMTPIGGTVLLNFTSDPQVRYDRFTARWFMSIIDVPCTTANCTTLAPNRWLLAVSDAASNGTITGATTWTFFYAQTDATNFCDYPSLGVDVNALYFGCNMFTAAGSFAGTNGYVVRKSSVLGAGPMTVTAFANLATSAGAGPFSPRGVDDYDPTATSGYFVGVDNAAFSTIMFRRVSSPGSATPTISANISVAVPTTVFPNPVTHLGNTGGNNGRLDSLDDRLFEATIRNGHLWAAHNIRVDATGVANTGAAARNASRWYEFQNLGATPTLVQSGTVFDSAGTLAAALQYWIPSIVPTGQGHAVLGFSMAGNPAGATPAYVGRLSGDALGAMTGPPSTGAVLFGTSAASYNPPSDPGGSSGRRWGDYSFTTVDPLDDMTVWTIQEYNQATNSYAVRVAKLLAPPPATPNCSVTPIDFPAGTGDVVIAATSSGGSGFYDPGADLAAPARAFHHLSATVTNATVNGVTYDSPTLVTLHITANTAGPQNVTITNPDGQSVTATGCINVVTGIVTHTVTPSVSGGNGTIAPSTPQTVNDGATVDFTLTPSGGYHIANVAGTCGGSLNGNVYTTNPVTADCTVVASFAIDTHTVTPSVNGGNGTIAPSTPQTVNDGATVDFTLTPSGGYHIANVAGTCGGSLNGNVYTTNPVTADCTVVASFAIDTHTVTPSVNGGNGTIAPSTPQTVNDGATVDFTLTPSGGYHIANVAGTCGGSLNGNVYTTNPVTADCTVIASFTADLSAPTLAKAFAPASVSVDVPSTATLTLSNTNPSAATLTAALVDTLPAGLVVANPANAATTCSGGSVSANAGDSTFSLGSGAMIPASASCTVSVDVVAATEGSYINTIAAGALQTDAGSNAAPATATLTVTPAVISDRIFCDGFDGVACAGSGIDLSAIDGGGTMFLSWVDRRELAGGG